MGQARPDCDKLFHNVLHVFSNFPQKEKEDPMFPWVLCVCKLLASKGTFFQFVLNIFSILPFSSTTGMKRPFSPSLLPTIELDKRTGSAELVVQMDSELSCSIGDEGVRPDEQSPGGDLHSTLCRPKRERKQRSYTLCDVCNIQLNSAAQAQIHYNGKSHQKRLKQVSNGKIPNNAGRS